MFRSLVAFLLGAALVGAAGYLWFRSTSIDCRHLCGDGTRCDTGLCVAVAPPAAPGLTLGPNKKKLGPRTGVYQAAKGLVILRPGDDQPTSAGDELGRPERIDLTKTGDDGKELDQDDIDRVFLDTAQNAVSQCIATTIGDAPLTVGMVDVGFRIERGGDVSRTRIEAPRLLVREGLLDCVRPVVKRLRFPRSGGATVVNYPFQIK